MSTYDDDMMMSTWVTTGYIDPAMSDEVKASCRMVSYEMHLEDQDYERLAHHLTDDHDVPEWRLMNAGTRIMTPDGRSGGVPTIHELHAELHATEAPA